MPDVDLPHERRSSTPQPRTRRARSPCRPHFLVAGGVLASLNEVLWINFLVNAPLGVALELDKEAPGLMELRPRPRDASIMNRGLLTTAGKLIARR